MKTSLWGALLSTIHSFFSLLSSHNFGSEPARKTHQNIEEHLKLLKPIIDSIVHADVASNDMLIIGLKQLVHSINKYRCLLENRHPLSSRVYFVLQAEALTIEVRAYVLEIVRQLKASCQCLPADLSSASLELCIQKVNDTRCDSCESASTIIGEAIMDQAVGFGPTPERFSKIAHHLDIKSNHDVLVETVALEKLKSAKQAENGDDVYYIEQLITLFTRMHDHLAILKLKETQNFVHIPTDFFCPLSLEFMIDPVITASGITYDRASIRKWLDLGLTMCPKTRQTLAHTVMIPNYTMKALILNWCQENDFELPFLSRSGLFLKLVEDLNSNSIEELRKATAQLLRYAKQNMDNRILIADSGGIKPLVYLLWSIDPNIQENSVSTLLYMAVNHDNKIAISNANAVEALINVLKFGTSEAQENAAATLFCLSMIKENKSSIGRSCAIPCLVALLRKGTPRGKNNAVIALFNLSICHENRVRIVNEGAVKLLVELVNDPVAGMVDKAVAVLESLSRIPEGRMAIGEAGGIPVLVNVLELGCARAKENAAASLLQLCVYSSRFCNMMLQEDAVPPLLALLLSGTPRAREKALALVNHVRSR